MSFKELKVSSWASADIIVLATQLPVCNVASDRPCTFYTPRVFGPPSYVLHNLSDTQSSYIDVIKV